MSWKTRRVEVRMSVYPSVDPFICAIDNLGKNCVCMCWLPEQFGIEIWPRPHNAVKRKNIKCYSWVKY